MSHARLTLAQVIAHNRRVAEEARSGNSMVGATEPERRPSVVCQPAQEKRSKSPLELRHRICITMYRCGKPLDRDNKWTAPKAVLDGLVEAFKLPGDSESQIDYIVEQVQVKTRKETMTKITVEELL